MPRPSACARCSISGASLGALRLGIYEKALPPPARSADGGWHTLLAQAARAGYEFAELAIDESDERRARLRWSAAERARLREAVAASGVPVRTWILSAQRATPLGSAQASTRAKALDMLRRCIDLAVDTGARLVQLPGYYVYYGPREAGARARFIDGLRIGLEAAAPAGVMLALETMDGRDITSVRRAMQIVRHVASPWLAVYADIGNLAANGLDVASELRAARGRLAGVHLKDARLGEYRRVPFGAGIVPFAQAFAALRGSGYDGPYVVEMWNEGDPDALQTVVRARRWLQSQAEAAA